MDLHISVQKGFFIKIFWVYWNITIKKYLKKPFRYFTSLPLMFTHHPPNIFLITIIWIKFCNHFWLNRYLVFKLLLLIHKNVCTWVTLIIFSFFYRFFSEFIFAYISCLLLYLVIKVSIRHFPNTAKTTYIAFHKSTKVIN